MATHFSHNSDIRNCLKSHQNIWATFVDNLLPRICKNSPIWSHCLWPYFQQDRRRHEEQRLLHGNVRRRRGGVAVRLGQIPEEQRGHREGRHLERARLYRRNLAS